ncbi:hypothetical protein [Larkinella arboricola]|uniref:Uncharacterized protein n=1 Tax=Larkinella arboricola TaxID=643671 RepID=A0A327X4F5_LARAB|nr:hypothetical protein [Larkinella arboricola]RAK00224.1 hypothetical protein LX87_01922 [Larkinella arboricola]
MENQNPQPQETTLDQTNYDSIDFDRATNDNEAAAMESGADLDDEDNIRGESD